MIYIDENGNNPCDENMITGWCKFKEDADGNMQYTFRFGSFGFETYRHKNPHEIHIGVEITSPRHEKSWYVDTADFLESFAVKFCKIDYT